MPNRSSLVLVAFLLMACERRSATPGAGSAQARLVRGIHASCDATCRHENACFGDEDVASCTEECESERSLHTSDACRERIDTLDRCLLPLSCDELATFADGIDGGAARFPCSRPAASYVLHCEDTEDALACNGICAKRQACEHAGRVDLDACGTACVEQLWSQAAVVGESCAARMLQYDECLSLLSCSEFRDARSRPESRICRTEKLARDRSCGPAPSRS